MTKIIKKTYKYYYRMSSLITPDATAANFTSSCPPSTTIAAADNDKVANTRSWPACNLNAAHI